MQIELTKEQYRTLLLITYLGEWVVNAHRLDDHNDEVTQLHHHILKHYKDFGETELVDPKPLNGNFFETKKMEDWAHEFIEEYDGETFWEELIRRFAARDFFKQNGEGAIKKMAFEEYHNGLDKLEGKYSDEFEANGLDNLNLTLDPFRKM